MNETYLTWRHVCAVAKIHANDDIDRLLTCPSRYTVFIGRGWLK